MLLEDEIGAAAEEEEVVAGAEYAGAETLDPAGEASVPALELYAGAE